MFQEILWNDVIIWWTGIESKVYFFKKKKTVKFTTLWASKSIFHIRIMLGKSVSSERLL